ncbi:hypothetical protein [Thalassotalea atypica]|uniref:hypothetical protein n=1 Tax=Thalassotalea atypica TaxID=2054316 RepID=UPI0025725A92|nr:hypothetical protein [Thalassotalea atypica]
MTQASFWHQQSQSPDYAELCNALYEREISILTRANIDSVQTLQAKLKSLPYYIQRAAYLMVTIDTPLDLDTQNATWSAKQGKKMPLAGQTNDEVWQWYIKSSISVGVVVPIYKESHIAIDCIDRIDIENQRYRTNLHGWFSPQQISDANIRLLKPTKKVMMAACAGHCWQSSGPVRPQIPSMRELLLSCSINWRNFKRSVQINEH